MHQLSAGRRSSGAGNTVVVSLFTVVVMACLAPSAAAQDGVTKPSGPKSTRISGRVVDSKGKPVKDAEVGIDWRGDEKRVAVDAPLKTDAKGNFSGDFLLDPKQPPVIMAMDRARKQGGWAIVADDKLESLEITIAQMTSMVGTFDVSRLKREPETVEIIVQTSPDKLDVVRYELPAKRRFGFRLPAGEYEISLKCEGGEREARLVNVPKGKAQHDMDKLPLRPAAAAKKDADEPAADGKKKSAGGSKPAPALNITDARGVAKDVSLASYKGKWVLLDFWGVWCPPCVRGSIPALMAFDDKHKADRSRYAILTMHCGAGRMPDNFSAIDTKLPELEKSLWNGRKFPFPILIDSTGRTQKAYGINAYPTAILIDPDGNIVAQGHAGIEEKLAEELKKSADATGSDDGKKKKEVKRAGD